MKTIIHTSKSFLGKFIEESIEKKDTIIKLSLPFLACMAFAFYVFVLPLIKAKAIAQSPEVIEESNKIMELSKKAYGENATLSDQEKLEKYLNKISDE